MKNKKTAFIGNNEYLVGECILGLKANYETEIFESIGGDIIDPI